MYVNEDRIQRAGHQTEARPEGEERRIIIQAAQRVYEKGERVRGQYNYRGYRLVNRYYDGWSAHKIKDGIVSEEAAACTPLLCLAKRAVDKILAG